MSDRRKDGVFLDIATDLATLGTCDRARVGAVITMNGRCISWGYNGAPPGMPHCAETNHGWGAVYTGWHLDTYGCRNAIHAEANAVAFAARQGISTEGGELYVSVSPCETCARILIAAGIWRVVYMREHREREGIGLLVKGGIQVVNYVHDYEPAEVSDQGPQG